MRPSPPGSGRDAGLRPRESAGALPEVSSWHGGGRPRGACSRPARGTSFSAATRRGRARPFAMSSTAAGSEPRRPCLRLRFPRTAPTGSTGTTGCGPAACTWPRAARVVPDTPGWPARSRVTLPMRGHVEDRSLNLPPYLADPVGRPRRRPQSCRRFRAVVRYSGPGDRRRPWGRRQCSRLPGSSPRAKTRAFPGRYPARRSPVLGHSARNVTDTRVCFCPAGLEQSA